MHNNLEFGGYGVPDWAEEIIERHDLGLRADAPLSAALVLLTDATADLAEVGHTVFQEQALLTCVMSRLSKIVSMVEDARKLSALCPSKPTAGTVAVSDDGTLCWAPMSPGKH